LLLVSGIALDSRSFFLLVLAGVVTDLILRDWILPHFALDNATAGEAWSRVWARIMAEKRQFFVYALLRVVLPLIAMVALFFVLPFRGSCPGWLTGGG
jgi:hypothetical protein